MKELLVGNAPCSWGLLENQDKSKAIQFDPCWMSWWRRDTRGPSWATGDLCRRTRLQLKAELAQAATTW